jgi:hypothetical protein
MKKMRVYLTALFVSCSLLVFNGCSNDESSGNILVQNVAETTPSNNLMSRSGVNSPENNLNPYDEVGVKHNIVISSVMANTSLRTTDDYINYARITSYNLFGWNETSAPSPTNLQIKNVINDVDHNFNNVINNSNFSTIGKQKLSDFVHIMLTANSNPNSNYNDLKSQLILFETDLNRDSQISSAEKQNILQVVSVARHSSYFWYINMLETQDYNKNVAINGIPKKRWWKWIVIATADALGGVAGAVVGSTTGIVAVGSSVLAAASASGGATTVINYLWPDPQQ